MKVTHPNSSFLYHLLSKNKAPGKNAASTNPRKNRVRRQPTKLWVIPVRHDIVPQQAIDAPMYNDGRLIKDIIPLDGISIRKY